jgi:hypothetical protein
MSAVLSARKSESNLNGPWLDPGPVSDLSQSFADWVSRMLRLATVSQVPARLRQDAGLPYSPSVEGRVWTDADRRRRLPL